GAVGRRHRAGDLLALDLVERGGFHVVAGLAIGGGNRRPAGRAARETAVDPVAVGIVGNDERTLFGLRRSAENGGSEDERGEKTPHPCPPLPRFFPGKPHSNIARKTLKGPLTAKADPRRQDW